MSAGGVGQSQSGDRGGQWGWGVGFKKCGFGFAAYPPSVMLKIILLGYAHGFISSRRIAKACEHNILFMSVSGDIQPHYTSIAGFVAKMHEQIEPLFTQVLMICDEEDLIGRNMFAIDGCKLKSNASKEWSGTFDELSRKKAKLELNLVQKSETLFIYLCCN